MKMNMVFNKIFMAAFITFILLVMSFGRSSPYRISGRFMSLNFYFLAFLRFCLMQKKPLNCRILFWFSPWFILF